MSIYDLKECPHCQYNLDGGDVYDQLRSLDSYKNYSDEEIKKMAESYGWSESNRVHFSNLIGIDLKYQCPNCKRFVK